MKFQKKAMFKQGENLGELLRGLSKPQKVLGMRPEGFCIN